MSTRTDWERDVLDLFVRRMPATGEAPDYVHALATAMLDTRTAAQPTDHEAAVTTNPDHGADVRGGESEER